MTMDAISTNSQVVSAAVGRVPAPAKAAPVTPVVATRVDQHLPMAAVGRKAPATVVLIRSHDTQQRQIDKVSQVARGMMAVGAAATAGGVAMRALAAVGNLSPLLRLSGSSIATGASLLAFGMILRGTAAIKQAFNDCRP